MTHAAASRGRRRIVPFAWNALAASLIPSPAGAFPTDAAAASVPPAATAPAAVAAPALTAASPPSAAHRFSDPI